MDLPELIGNPRNVFTKNLNLQKQYILDIIFQNRSIDVLGCSVDEKNVIIHMSICMTTLKN